MREKIKRSKENDDTCNNNDDEKDESSIELPLKGNEMRRLVFDSKR